MRTAWLAPGVTIVVTLVGHCQGVESPTSDLRTGNAFITDARSADAEPPPVGRLGTNPSLYTGYGTYRYNTNTYPCLDRPSVSKMDLREAPAPTFSSRKLRRSSIELSASSTRSRYSPDPVTM
jgi:hypothetical protein